MRTTRLKDILLAVADLSGVQYDRQLSPAQLAAMIRVTGEALSKVWTSYPWPELATTARYFMSPALWVPNAAYEIDTVVRVLREDVPAYFRKLTPKAAGFPASYSLGTNATQSSYGSGQTNHPVLTSGMAATPVVGDIVEVGGAAYTLTAVLDQSPYTGLVFGAAGTGTPINLPYPLDDALNAADWETADFTHYVELADTIGIVVDAYDSDPGTAPYASRVDYRLAGRRVYVGSDVPEVWLETIAAEPMLDATPWSETETSVAGMVRYYEGTISNVAYGDCYKCIVGQAPQINPPPINTAAWTKIEIPALFAAPVKYYASADRLRADGKESTAIQRDRKGDSDLDDAMNTVHNLQHQAARFAVRSN